MLNRDLASKLGALRAFELEARPARSGLSTGAAALDEHLGGGLPRGAVTEIFGAQGEGAWWLGLRALAHASQPALVETAGTFFPPGAACLGVDLHRLLVVREPNHKRAAWALERIAREPAITACLAAIPALGDTEVRRLQLAAEASGQALILLREESELSRSSWGALRLMVRAEPGPGRRIVVETLRMRGAFMPRPMLLELEDDSVAVRTSALLPHTEAHARRAGDRARGAG